MNHVVGFRFLPKDEELILHYLLNKVHNQNFNGYGIVADADVFELNPKDLHDLASYRPDDGSLYFFVQRTRRYKNGKRPRRTQTKGQGTWKPTQSDQEIMNRGRLIGHKKLLAYHVNKVKTHWRMHEYTLPKLPLSSVGEYLDIVLCRVFLKGVKGDEKMVQFAEQVQPLDSFMPVSEEPREMCYEPYTNSMVDIGVEDEVMSNGTEMMVPVVEQVEQLDSLVPVLGPGEPQGTCSEPCTNYDYVGSTMEKTGIEDESSWEDFLDMGTIDRILHEPTILYEPSA